MPSLRIAVDARRIQEGFAGGVEQIVIGLAHGLSALDGSEEYLFLTTPSDPDWIAPYLSGNCRVLVSRATHHLPEWRRRLSTVSPLRRAWEGLSPILGERTIPIGRSDGTIENSAADVVHFPQQSAFLTEVPSIYQPHDLQHLHLQQFFSRRARLAREVTYRAFCAQASAVVMMTHWGRRDILKAYDLPDDRVCVVRGASVLSAYPVPSEDDVARVRRHWRLPELFAFFPAQTFPHKNHLRLLEALAIARDQHGVTIPLVSTGLKNDFFAEVAARANDLALTGQVHFLGFVPPLDLRVLYRSARCLVFPSTFEGWGLPVVEAFSEGLPVACADATSLPEVANGAALLFPPHDANLMANAIARLWTDDSLHRRLAERGHARAGELSWTRTARVFRAHYRRVAGRLITADDQALIDESFGRANRPITASADR
jgi:glycosyltransferase involved in cell wall biosynthesis